MRSSDIYSREYSKHIYFKTLANQSSRYQTAFSRHERKAASMKYQQYGCLNKTCTMTALTDGPIQKVEISQGPIPRRRTKVLREGKLIFSRNKNSNNSFSSNWQVLNTRTYKQQWMNSVSCMCVLMHICMYKYTYISKHTYINNSSNEVINLKVYWKVHGKRWREKRRNVIV